MVRVDPREAKLSNRLLCAAEAIPPVLCLVAPDGNARIFAQRQNKPEHGQAV